MVTRPITVLTLLQLALITGIFFAVGMFMKVHGYPDARPWPFLALAFREHLFLWLLMPLAWMSVTLVTLARTDRYHHLLLTCGAVFAGLISVLGMIAVIQAFIGPVRPLLWIRV